MGDDKPVARLSCHHYDDGNEQPRVRPDFEAQVCISALWEIQELRREMEEAGVLKPRLRVTTPDDAGRERVLTDMAVHPGAPQIQHSECVDDAGYAYTLYPPMGHAPWGTVIFLSKDAQLAFAERWGKALAAQGLEVRRYAIEAAARNPCTQNGNHITLPRGTTEFSAFRWGVEPAMAVTEARAAYDATRRIIAATDPKPLAACMWGHSEYWHRAPTQACREAGVQTLHFEGAMFPRLSHLEHGRQLDGGHAIVNSSGQYYENAEDIDGLWRRVSNQPLTPPQTARVESYVAAWRSAKASKYGQNRGGGGVEAEGKRVLFVPLQIDRDASLYYADDALVKAGVELLKLVAEAAPSRLWQIIVKPHPHDQAASAGGGGGGPLASVVAGHGHVQVVRGTSIHDLFAVADCVCGINSTVLMEALCYDLPSIALGTSCFTGKGFTFDIRDEDALRNALRFDRKALAVTDDMRTRFRRFLHMMMWEGNDGNGFFVDIDCFDAGRLVGA